MKKWIMPIAVVAICILAASVAMPICLADQNRIEIEGKLEVGVNQNPLTADEYNIGELHKGDKIKVVMSDMRGDGDIKVLLANTSIKGREVCLNNLYDSFWGPGVPYIICCLPCQIYYVIFPKPTVSVIEKTTIVYEGEEKTFIVPEDGIYYLVMEGDRGRVVYKGYIEVIKTEK